MDEDYPYKHKWCINDLDDSIWGYPFCEECSKNARRAQTYAPYVSPRVREKIPGIVNDFSQERWDEVKDFALICNYCIRLLNRKRERAGLESLPDELLPDGSE